MSIFWWLLGAGAAAHLLLKDGNSGQVEKVPSHDDYECLFTDGISQEKFTELAAICAKKFKRLNVAIDSSIVYATVESQSGLSQWSFSVDYNDYGHITGKHWIITENMDSKIPDCFSENLATEVKYYLSHRDEIESQVEKSVKEHEENDISKGEVKKYCPYCGSKRINPAALFCSSCGRKLR